MLDNIHRRGVLAAAAAAAVSTPALGSGSIGSRSVTPPPLAPRLRAASLVPLRNLGVNSREGALHYPEWLRGTWRVRNEVSSFSMPLGSAFVDEFTRYSANEDITQGVVYNYLLRFVSDDPSDAQSAGTALSAATTRSAGEAPYVIQDRAFNALEETRAFLGADADAVSIERSRYSTPASAPHGCIELLVRDGIPDSPEIAIGLTVDWCQWETQASITSSRLGD